MNFFLLLLFFLYHNYYTVIYVKFIFNTRFKLNIIHNIRNFNFRVIIMYVRIIALFGRYIIKLLIYLYNVFVISDASWMKDDEVEASEVACILKFGVN